MGNLKQFKAPSQQTLTVKALSSAYVRRKDLRTGLSYDIVTNQTGSSVYYIEPDTVERTIRIYCQYGNSPSGSPSESRYWSTSGCLYLWATGAVSNTSDVTPLTWTRESSSGSSYVYTVTLPANKYLCLSQYSKSTNPTGGVVQWYSAVPTNKVSSVETGGWKDIDPNEKGPSDWGIGNIYKMTSGSWTQ